jgi:hypothetical protein
MHNLIAVVRLERRRQRGRGIAKDAIRSDIDKTEVEQDDIMQRVYPLYSRALQAGRGSNLGGGQDLG